MFKCMKGGRKDEGVHLCCVVSPIAVPYSPHSAVLDDANGISLALHGAITAIDSLRASVRNHDGQGFALSGPLYPLLRGAHCSYTSCRVTACVEFVSLSSSRGAASMDGICCYDRCVR